MNIHKNVKTGIAIGLGFFSLVAIWDSFYSTPEGHVTIVKRFGEAIHYTEPGINSKIPFVDRLEEMEVRTRKYKLKLNASTTGKNAETGQVELQMPSQVIISANWNIPMESALSIFKEYGSLEQYEDRILDPRVNRATKQVFAKYSIEQVVSEREIVRNAIEFSLSDALSGKLATMSDINIEDVSWSPKIRDAVEKKQKAKFEFEQEKYTLDKQNLQAQQSVNTANADAEAIDTVSIANAEKIKREGLAEAEALQAKALVLAKNPQLVELIKAERWDGVLPKVSGSNAGFLLQADALLQDKPPH